MIISKIDDTVLLIIKMSMIFLIHQPVDLRVVLTQAILYLKSMSERVGSDIQRLCSWMMNSWIDSKSIEDDLI